MTHWRISKYNPRYRNEKGEYQQEEWTSFHDIGKWYDDKEFTFTDYVATENAYIYTVLLFMKEANITTLTVKQLEKNNNISLEKNPLGYTEEMIELFESLQEGIVLGIKDIEHLCRFVLRERLWCKLESDNTMFVHFGYDYYMYIGCLSHSVKIVQLIEKAGLSIEKFESPYL